MRTLRPLLITLLLVFGFYAVTNRMARSAGNPASPFHALLTSAHLGAGSVAAGPIGITQAEAAPAFDQEELENINVYKRGMPSVVNITSTAVGFDFFYGPVPQQGQGSGFILDTQGHILTNYHVIADARRVEVTLHDKHQYPATIVASDKGHDLALLQIKNAPNLQPATLSDSRNLVVGQKVYAIGNPFGLSGTMTRGIISSIRSIRGPTGAPIEDAIQTDAAINPGNSGGPLLNSRGEVIGITSLIAQNGADQSSGIGFAIPINTAKAVLDDFQRYGRVRRPSLGIASLPIGPDLAQQMGLAADSGVLIERVTPGGAAEKAGLRGGTEKAYLGNTLIMLGGDLIIAMDGQQITNTQDISQMLNGHRAGDTVTVTIYRGHRRMDVRLTMGEAGDVQA
jgi:S1-C subfamily serine protease